MFVILFVSRGTLNFFCILRRADFALLCFTWNNYRKLYLCIPQRFYLVLLQTILKGVLKPLHFYLHNLFHVKQNCYIPFAFCVYGRFSHHSFVLLPKHFALFTAILQPFALFALSGKWCGPPKIDIYYFLFQKRLYFAVSVFGCGFKVFHLQTVFRFGCCNTIEIVYLKNDK